MSTYLKDLAERIVKTAAAVLVSEGLVSQQLIDADPGVQYVLLVAATTLAINLLTRFIGSHDTGSVVPELAPTGATPKTL